MYNYLKSGVESKAAIPTVDIHTLAIGYFLVFTTASYLLYISKKEKG